MDPELEAFVPLFPRTDLTTRAPGRRTKDGPMKLRSKILPALCAGVAAITACAGTVAGAPAP
ncbi:hypothetical protein NJL88_10515 [Streptomyces sp. DK15]|uniref:hypothetical protein n=1 Tax=Streptomyces sp. DK15 TaxID=2957499 RepID=UPI0029BE252D|nr:hypothetical protein [Streptomyces sp. DK15]MDX2390485.1 hypothetical protein [Streptomyces sp. DK15]